VDLTPKRKAEVPADYVRPPSNHSGTDPAPHLVTYQPNLPIAVLKLLQRAPLNLNLLGLPVSRFFNGKSQNQP